MLEKLKNHIDSLEPNNRIKTIDFLLGEDVEALEALQLLKSKDYTAEQVITAFKDMSKANEEITRGTIMEHNASYTQDT